MRLEIIEYADRYSADFKRINLEWLDKYNLTEELDLLMLDDPKGTILSAGGAVYLAKVDDEIVGSAALVNEQHGVYELAKMSVIPFWQGKGISRLLLEKCLERARELNAKKIILFSNHQLQAALGLYLKYGFKHVEVTDSHFINADVRMELLLE